MPFQTSVAQDLPYGIPGDFATTAPWHVVPSLPGELGAGPAGVTCAIFAWADDTTGLVTNGKPNATNSTRIGFVGRAQRSVITDYLAESSMLINAGMEVTLYEAGSFFITSPGTVKIGQKVFARYLNGTIVIGTAGTPPTSTLSVTTVNASPNITFTGGTLAPGMPITGTGIPANTVVSSVNAGAGTAVLSANATAAGTVTATISTAYETRFFVKTPGVAGEILVIADRGF